MCGPQEPTPIILPTPACRFWKCGTVFWVHNPQENDWTYLRAPCGKKTIHLRRSAATVHTISGRSASSAGNPPHRRGSRSVRFFTSVRTFCRGPSPIFLAGPFRISCRASRPCSPLRKPSRSHKDNVSGRISYMRFSSVPRPYHIISYCLASMYFVTPLTHPIHA